MEIVSPCSRVHLKNAKDADHRAITIKSPVRRSYSTQRDGGHRRRRRLYSALLREPGDQSRLCSSNEIAGLRGNKYSGVLPVEETTTRPNVAKRPRTTEKSARGKRSRRGDRTMRCSAISGREELQARGVIGRDWRATRSKCQREPREQETPRRRYLLRKRSCVPFVRGVFALPWSQLAGKEKIVRARATALSDVLSDSSSRIPREILGALFQTQRARETLTRGEDVPRDRDDDDGNVNSQDRAADESRGTF